jgi:hypothetical protein
MSILSLFPRIWGITRGSGTSSSLKCAGLEPAGEVVRMTGRMTFDETTTLPVAFIPRQINRSTHTYHG